MITFQSFLQAMRRQKHIDLSVLGMGICSRSYLSRIESGSRVAPYLLRKRLIGRLGAVGENFYEYLQPKEYKAWKLRQDIVFDILYKDYESANKKIELLDENNSDDIIAQQFYLYIKAELSVKQGASLKDNFDVYEKAVSCSMGHLVNNFREVFDKSLLSPLEYCIFIKYIAAKLDAYSETCSDAAEEELNKLCKIMDRAKDNKVNLDMLSKVYSMALAYFIIGVEKFFPNSEVYAREVKDRCFNAVDYLRHSQKTFFLSIITDALRKNSFLNQEEMRKRYEIEEYYLALKDLYLSMGLSIEECTGDSIYILFESGAYAIGDIFLKRRKMLKMTQKELCDNICTEKTLSRIENGKCSIQDIIYKQVCERLHLVPDYMYGEIVSDNVHTYEQYKKLKYADNSNNCNELRIILKKLKPLLDMDISNNKQCWARALNNYKVKSGEISYEKYCENIKKLLSLSVNDIDEIDSECVYFNDAELMLLQNLSLRCGRGKRKYLELLITGLKNETRDFILNGQHRLNSFLLSYYASELGNEESYEDSNSLSEKIIELSLRMNNLVYVAYNIYNIYWNNQKNGKCSNKDIDLCIMLSKYSNNWSDVEFYSSKKKMIKN